MPSLRSPSDLPTASDKYKVSLLLGNGFSRAFDDTVFSYHSLSENASFAPFDVQIASLFSSLGSRDFEFAMRTLQDAAKAIPAFCAESEQQNPSSASLLAASELLREALGKAVLLNHPIASTIVTQEESARCAQLLKKFSQVFTVNYDLLLYWVLMQQYEFLKINKYESQFCDGFGWGVLDPSKIVWPSQNTTKQNVFYLHGALHLFRHSHGVEKAKYSAHADGKPLKLQIEERVDAGTLPLLVTEGAGSHKLDRILSNPYLSYCYQRLLGLGDCIVTLGFGFNETDAHIDHALIMSKVDRLWIGCHEPIGQSVPTHVVEHASKLVERRKAFYSDASAQASRQIKGKPLTVDFFSTVGLKIWRG